jgi:hypothetical protein
MNIYAANELIKYGPKDPKLRARIMEMMKKKGFTNLKIGKEGLKGSSPLKSIKDEPA